MIHLKNLCWIVQSDDEVLSTNLTFQFSSDKPNARVEFLDQLLNRIFKTTKQAIAQSLSARILVMKVDPNVSNLTILSTTVGAILKLLLKV